jgi:hypothetical protein
MKRVEDYARWITGGSTLIAGLMAVFVNSSLVTLDAWGHRALVLSMLLLAGSMACAASVLAPVWGSYNPNSVESIEAAIQKQYDARRPWLRRAALLFILSLLAAGIAPSTTGFLTPRYHDGDLRLPITYVLGAGGSLESTLSVRGARPGAAFELELTRLAPGTELIARSRGTTDSSGSGTVSLKATGLARGQFRLASACQHLPDVSLKSAQAIDLAMSPQWQHKTPPDSK